MDFGMVLQSILEWNERCGNGDSGASPRSLSGPVEMEQAPRIAN